MAALQGRLLTWSLPFLIGEAITCIASLPESSLITGMMAAALLPTGKPASQAQNALHYIGLKGRDPRIFSCNFAASGQARHFVYLNKQRCHHTFGTIIEGVLTAVKKPKAARASLEKHKMQPSLVLLLECNEATLQSLLTASEMKENDKIMGNTRDHIEALLARLYDICSMGQSEAVAIHLDRKQQLQSISLDGETADASSAIQVPPNSLSCSDHARHLHDKLGLQQQGQTVAESIWRRGSRFTEERLANDSSRKSNSLQASLRDTCRRPHSSWQQPVKWLPPKPPARLANSAEGGQSTLKSGTVAHEKLQMHTMRQSAPAAFPAASNKHASVDADTQQARAGPSRNALRPRKSLDEIFSSWQNNCIRPQTRLPVLSVADLQRSAKV